ncbi:hypothetical protein B0A52_00551 [Exophiala mesophila]|uniref:WSC domain-containing protein n=1 Tax=Exophiala mesophila TaxID=212818 RepID=A0A438NHJ3_EXOME|nr:hypothetical protein B0A52_00551 [Exophiala mesophila]
MTFSIRPAVAFASAAFLLASSVLAQSPTNAPRAITTLGCYASPDPLEEFGDATYQSSGYCQVNCTGLAQPVMAITGGSTCFCGDEIPPKDQEVDPSNCDSVCGGYGEQTCGGLGYWQVYLTGLTANVHTAPNSTSSTASSPTSESTSSAPAVVTKAGETVFVTNPPNAANASSSGGGPNKVGIAVGVVVGVIALAGIIGAVVFIVKRKRNREIEEEHRRNAAVSAFVGAKSDKSSTDQRLDPSIFSNDSLGRQSIGSIADERDFSRRILQVRNPDRDSRSSAMA